MEAVREEYERKTFAGAGWRAGIAPTPV